MWWDLPSQFSLEALPAWDQSFLCDQPVRCRERALTRIIWLSDGNMFGEYCITTCTVFDVVSARHATFHLCQRSSNSRCVWVKKVHQCREVSFDLELGELHHLCREHLRHSKLASSSICHIIGQPLLWQLVTSSLVPLAKESVPIRNATPNGILFRDVILVRIQQISPFTFCITYWLFKRVGGTGVGRRGGEGHRMCGKKLFLLLQHMAWRELPGATGRAIGDACKFSYSLQIWF